MTRQMLTREKALSWSRDWSDTDRRLIGENLNRLDAQTFYMPPTGGYIGCVDADGTVVMTIHSGYLEFKCDLAPADLPDPKWPGLTLSTFSPNVSPNRRMLTREKALNWSQDWSDTDRKLIGENLNRLDAQTFYMPPSGGYIGCVDVQARVVMTIHSGYLEFKRDLAPADLPDPDWPGLTLSTFIYCGPRTPSPDDEVLQFCPIHNIALPATGICDECQ
jgi:hypothetical protein